LLLQMSEWIANNREVFLVTYTQIGSSHQQALDLQLEHSQFAMSAMVCMLCANDHSIFASFMQLCMIHVHAF